MLTGEEVARRVAQEVQPGMRVQVCASLAPEYASALPEGTELVAEGADIALVGADQVSAKGDLVCSGAAPTAKRVIAVFPHCTESGAARIVEACTGTVTAAGAVQRIVTDLAVIDVQPEGLVVREVAGGISARDVQDKTGAPLLAASDMRLLKV